MTEATRFCSFDKDLLILEKNIMSCMFFEEDPKPGDDAPLFELNWFEKHLLFDILPNIGRVIYLLVQSAKS